MVRALKKRIIAMKLSLATILSALLILITFAEQKVAKLPHEYTIHDKVILDLGDIKGKYKDKYDRPYVVVQVNDNNGTVRI